MEWKQSIFSHIVAVSWKKTSVSYFDMFSILEAASILFQQKHLEASPVSATSNLQSQKKIIQASANISAILFSHSPETEI